MICAEYVDSRKILMSALIKKTTHAHATNKLNTNKDKSYNFRSNILKKMSKKCNLSMIRGQRWSQAT